MEAVKISRAEDFLKSCLDHFPANEITDELINDIKGTFDYQVAKQQDIMEEIERRMTVMKTFKETVEMNLHELIEHIWKNNITNKYYHTIDKSLYVDSKGKIIPEAHFSKDCKFKVELEKEITPTTKLDTVHVVLTNTDEDKLWSEELYLVTIIEVIDSYGDAALSIHTKVNSRLECLWERD